MTRAFSHQPQSRLEVAVVGGELGQECGGGQGVAPYSGAGGFDPRLVVAGQ